MGLPNFPCAAEGVLPVLVINTVVLVTLLKNVLRWSLHVIRNNQSPPLVLADETNREYSQFSDKEREIRTPITLFKCLCENKCHTTCSNNGYSSKTCAACSSKECCVCLYGIEDNEEVYELSCKHFFHKGCLEKWFDHNHRTCPLCRATM